MLATVTLTASACTTSDTGSHDATTKATRTGASGPPVASGLTTYA
ncbi:hypothetical protein QFZ63_002004 [Streptomyces sp. B3I7]|nr:hypothetical protein [Streptomyces sp. B3I7]MDQ0810290.1 hypothetical protein [Streptomyces sp. B3I7]